MNDYPYYKHQLEAIKHITDYQGNCLIGDPPRLGKTAPAIGYAYEQKQLPCLVVCPNSVVIKWQREIKSVVGIDAVIIKTAKDTVPENNEFVIIPYSLLSKQGEMLRGYGFKQIIYDEAHRLKNSKALVTKAAHKYLKETPSILLTGTPILNAPRELWSLFVLLGISGKISYNEFAFQKYYCNGHYETINIGMKFKKIWAANGVTHAKELKKLIKIHANYLRRTFIEVWGDDCQQIIQGNEYIDVKLSVVETKTLQSFVETGIQSAKVKSVRRDIGIKKIKKVASWANDWLKYNSGKLIVFAHHIDVQNGVTELMGKHVIARIVGGMKASIREAQVKLFQDNKECRLAILSIKAASEGVTLDKADHVCFAEYDYTPSVNVQAMNRGYSIQRTTPLSVTFLVVPNSYDERILSIIKGKQKTIGKVI